MMMKLNLISNNYKKMVKIDITPDKTLFPKLGSSGYSIPQALAELIDNSIDARVES